MKHGDEQFAAGLGRRFRIEERLHCHCGGSGLGWILNPGGGSTTPSAPDPSSVSGNYLQLLAGFSQGLPTLLADQNTYGPGFTQAGLTALNQGLYGGNGMPGYLGQTEQAAGVGRQLTRQGRVSNVNDISALGGRAAAAVRGANPQQTALLDALTGTASSQLAAGTQLDPNTLNSVTQGVRGDWSNRGLGSSPAAQLDEAVNVAAGGQNLLNQREAAAGSAVNLQNSTVTQPALSIASNAMGLPGLAQSLVSGGAGLSSGTGNTIINPSQSYDMFNTAYNAQAAANIAGANNQAALDAY